MDVSTKIDYQEAERGMQYVLFKKGLYTCCIISAEYKLDNEYEGKPSPVCTLKIKPLKSAIGDPQIYGTDGKKRDSDYTDQDGNERERFLFFNIALPPRIAEKSNFGKLFRAISGDTPEGEKKVRENYPTMESFVGQTLI